MARMGWAGARRGWRRASSTRFTHCDVDARYGSSRGSGGDDWRPACDGGSDDGAMNSTSPIATLPSDMLAKSISWLVRPNASSTGAMGNGRGAC